MSATTVTEIPLVPIPLEPRELPGGAAGAAGVAKDLTRFSFGRTNPVAVTSPTPDIDDPELSRDLEGDQDHRFFSLAFTCSFRPDDEPLACPQRGDVTGPRSCDHLARSAGA